MRTFPSAIYRLIGRLEVSGASKKCVMCEADVDLFGHEEWCPVLAALKEADKIAQDDSEPRPGYVPPFNPYDPNAPQVWYGTGPATCKSPTANVPLPPEGTTI